MREIRPSGSEGGGNGPTRSSLPLSLCRRYRGLRRAESLKLALMGRSPEAWRAAATDLIPRRASSGREASLCAKPRRAAFRPPWFQPRALRAR